MILHYLLVFLGSMLVDIVPFPLPPAFTVMIFLQIKFDLPIWPVIIVGVAGSVLGRYVLTLYIPAVSQRLFTRHKNEDVKYLGDKLREKSWRSHALVLGYSLMPLPTTPLFLAAGMARMRPYMIIPAFIIGKFSSDMVAVLVGKYAADNAADIFQGMISWKSISGLALGLLLVFSLLFIDWHTLLRERKLKINFRIFKRRGHQKKIK